MPLPQQLNHYDFQNLRLRLRRPSDPQTLRPSDSQTLSPSDSQTLSPSDSQTLSPSDPQTLRLSDSQTLRPSDPQTLIRQLADQTLIGQSDHHAVHRVAQYTATLQRHYIVYQA